MLVSLVQQESRHSSHDSDVGVCGATGEWS